MKNLKRNSTGFGDLSKDGVTIAATQDQLLAICDVFSELDSFTSDRRTIAPKGGLRSKLPPPT